MVKINEINLPQRTFFGPGPGNVQPRVYRALATPLVGHLEIGGGLGELAGKIWRIGLIGESSQKANVVYLLAALREIMQSSE